MDEAIEELVATFESFPDHRCRRSFPIVAFTEGAKHQLVWYDCSLLPSSARPATHSARPDMMASDPVVMSPAYLGFTVEPYEERYLHYNGVGMMFARPRGGKFMQPSIDTILVCHGLEKVFERGLAVRNAIDVGSGSGFIGKFIAKKAPGDGDLHVTLNDIDATAMTFAQSSGFGRPSTGFNDRGLSFSFEGVDAARLLSTESSQYDFIVSNPPYIPTGAEVRGGKMPSTDRHNFWEGTSLLVYLTESLLDGRFAPGASLVLALSSMSLKSKPFVNALERCAAEGVAADILVEREVGYKGWYAGDCRTAHLEAEGDQTTSRVRIGTNEFFVGMVHSSDARCPRRETDIFDYDWHMAYVLHLHH